MAQDEPSDPDRAAILARRRRFIALAISGLTTGGCKHQSPQPCLSIEQPQGEADAGAEAGVPEGEGQGEPSATGPFVEDPGAPVGGETGGSGTSEPPEANPRPCLKVRPTPQPCLNVYRK